MPVRKIPKNWTCITGFIVSAKMGRKRIYWEGEAEWTLFLWLEMDREVLSYEEQPLYIPFTSAKGRPAQYPPDARASYRSGRTVYWEAKSPAQMSKAIKEKRLQYRAVFGYLRARGEIFKLFTPNKLSEAFRDNIRFLKPTLLHDFSDLQLEYVLEGMRRLRETTPETLVDFLAENTEEKLLLFPVLWRLVAEGQIHADLDQPLVNGCRIWLESPVENERCTR